MFEKYVRTDLAVEIQEDVGKENNMEGLEIHQFEDETHSLVKTHIKITNSTGAAHPQMLEITRPLLDDLKAMIPVVFDDITYEEKVVKEDGKE